MNKLNLGCLVSKKQIQSFPTQDLQQFLDISSLMLIKNVKSVKTAYTSC